MSAKKPKEKLEKWAPAPPPHRVWAVVTRDPNIYLVGQIPLGVITHLTEGALALVLHRPSLMFRQGTTIRFEKLDGFTEEFYVPVSGALAYGKLAEPYVTHYLTYIGLGSQNPGPPGPPKE